MMELFGPTLEDIFSFFHRKLSIKNDNANFSSNAQSNRVHALKTFYSQRYKTHKFFIRNT